MDVVEETARASPCKNLYTHATPAPGLELDLLIMPGAGVLFRRGSFTDMLRSSYSVTSYAIKTTLPPPRHTTATHAIQGAATTVIVQENIQWHCRSHWPGQH